jgi:ATPase family associated with various cellular activities (AAA)
MNKAPRGVSGPGRFATAIAVRAVTKWPESPYLDPNEIQLVHGWHCVGEAGAWNIDAMCLDLGGKIVHSHLNGTPVSSDSSRKCRHLVFAIEEEILVAVSEDVPGCRILRLWARSAAAAEAEFRKLRTAYFREQRDDEENSHFFILTIRGGEPDARLVRIAPTGQSRDDLVLHYGEEFEEWHRRFVAELSARRTGLTILRGEPGTGKTTYLRHLLYELRETHRFYYLPLPAYSLLTSPLCVDFWITENDKPFTKVVVLEDAEALLAERHAENQESLSSLLNIADGFLGDFLRMHVICTMNAPIGKLDPAVKRSGRLIAARQFERLDWPQAQRLARARGLCLEHRESYSLAEIYASSQLTADLTQDHERKVGFAA